MNILLTILIKFSDRGREKEREGVTHLITNYPSSTRTNGNCSPREGGRRYLSERNDYARARIRYRKNRGTISRELARPRIIGTLIRLAFCTCSLGLIRQTWGKKMSISFRGTRSRSISDTRVVYISLLSLQFSPTIDEREIDRPCAIVHDGRAIVRGTRQRDNVRDSINVINDLSVARSCPSALIAAGRATQQRSRFH